jgi:hypothetical protein
MANLRASVLFGLVLVAAVLSSAAAMARVEARPGYTKNQTFSGALRYVRLDLGYEVVEKDPEAAYLIFRYAGPGQKKAELTGTCEIIEIEGEVRLYINLPRMPEYHERVFRDGLLRKLRDEYGAPRSAPKPKPDPAEKPQKPPVTPGDSAAPS